MMATGDNRCKLCSEQSSENKLSHKLNCIVRQNQPKMDCDASQARRARDKPVVEAAAAAAAAAETTAADVDRVGELLKLTNLKINEDNQTTTNSIIIEAARRIKSKRKFKMRVANSEQQQQQQPRIQMEVQHQFNGSRAPEASVLASDEQFAHELQPPEMLEPVNYHYSLGDQQQPLSASCHYGHYALTAVPPPANYYDYDSGYPEYCSVSEQQHQRHHNHHHNHHHHRQRLVLMNDNEFSNTVHHHHLEMSVQDVDLHELESGEHFRSPTKQHQHEQLAFGSLQQDGHCEPPISYMNSVTDNYQLDLECASLPESVIRVNHQQEQVHIQEVALIENQFEDQHHQHQHQHQHHQHQQCYTSLQNHHHQQHLDSGHISSMSCADSSSSSMIGVKRTSSMLSLAANHSALQVSDGAVSAGSQAEHLELRAELDLKVCEWAGCEHTFLDMNEFVKHLEDRHVNQEPKEKNRYFCRWSNCKRNEQEFNARYKLLIHMRVHSGEKPYPCNNENCKKSFSRLENLKIHVRSHTGEKPYKCNFDNCSKSFTNSSDRIKHHKTHKDPKPYSCSYHGCTKRYTDPSSLRKHLRAHKTAQLVPDASFRSAPEKQSSSAGVWPQSVAPVACTADYDPSTCLPPSSTRPDFEPDSGLQQRQQQHQYYHQNNNHSRSHNYTYSQQQQQQQQQQHGQLSRSWCAGATRPLDNWERQSWAGGHWAAPQQSTAGLLPLAGQTQRPVGFNLPTATRGGQRMGQQHEALMRSLPPNGFREQ